ncbi:hypothetical protein [uncultured Sphingomonas sp.]|uniref:hypothetical protein n=1 Tax=uncultured Sphingomonas sp. TaxID=158754 RepID=UPI00261AC382|nr:hypothetical protein [uncultured Sphingomonas sp.]
MSKGRLLPRKVQGFDKLSPNGEGGKGGSPAAFVIPAQVGIHFRLVARFYSLIRVNGFPPARE